MQQAYRNATLALLASLPFFLPSAPGAAEPGQAGDVRFPISCETVQAEFEHAVTLLHSFEYPETLRLFRRIAERDPECAMARWGIAMSMWHPLWEPPSVSDLAQGAEALRGTESMQLSPSEAGWLEAAHTFFADTDPATHRERAAAHSARMAKLYEEQRDDPEAAVFYALSLLAIADPRDKRYARQLEAAGILNRVRESQPRHPGALHYLIHAYDFPGLAELALPAATVYADAAPDSAHAQHMPSHIFTRLGLWERAIRSNRRSSAAAAEYTERAHLPGHYDEGLHSIDYQVYALLQTARDEQARRLLATLASIGKSNVDNFKVAYAYAAAPARYALERRAWDEASRLELAPVDFPWAAFPWAQSIHHFARGLGAARSGDPGRAHAELARIRELSQLADEAMPVYWREEMFVHADAVAAWIAFAEGSTEQALAHAAAAAAREDAVDKHPVTPGEVLPARELYADMLLELERYGEAGGQYRRVLHVAPNRYNALLGAARAAAGAGDAEAAHSYYAALVDIAPEPAPGRASLAEARRYLTTRATATTRPVGARPAGDRHDGDL